MQNKKQQSQAAFDAQASSYDTTFYGQHARTLYPHMLNEIIHHYAASILDLGCGTGEL